MVAHHTVGGCNLQPGDLIGTGTQSGPTPDEAAALIELTVGGKQPGFTGTADTTTTKVLKGQFTITGNPKELEL